MAMMPKKVKFRKQMRGSNKGIALRGATISFGEYALKSVDRGLLTARQIVPQLTQTCMDKIKERMRGVVEYRKLVDNNMPFTIRQLHAMTRISCAFAKLRLSDKVEEEDVDNAWNIYVNSIKSTHIHNEVNQEEQKVL